MVEGPINMALKKLAAAFGLAVALYAPVAFPASEGGEIAAQDWTFDDPFFGYYDYASIQRGFQVYREVCAACHALTYIAYRNLEEIGFSEGQIEAVAADYLVEDGPDSEGQMFTRPGRASDPFVAPYPNEEAARFANNGAMPPDLSLIAKARHDGANYVYAFLLGFHDEAPEGVVIRPGQYYNEAYGGPVAMPPVLLGEDEGGSVVYADGPAATQAQQAWDVVNFLRWAAFPEFEERRDKGLHIVFILIFVAGIAYAVKRRVWAGVAH